MKSVEISEKTVELAIEKGLQQLDATIDNVETEVLSAGGLFSKAKVRLTIKDSVGEKAQNFLEELFKLMKLGALVEADENDTEAVLNVVGADLSLLYENNGEVFDAIQYITSLIANKDNDEYKKIILESEDFRKQREEKLQEFAQAMAERAVSTKRKVRLEPMNPYQRRVIHTKLQDNDEVTTRSEGVEPYRSVVITPKNFKPNFEHRPNNSNYKPRDGQRQNTSSSRNGNDRRNDDRRPDRSGGYNKDRAPRPGYGAKPVNKLSGFSTGSLIKRNPFDNN